MAAAPAKRERIKPTLDDWFSLAACYPPSAHIASRPELEVIILESENNGLGRDATDALGPDGWLTVRDPTGAFTAAFQAMGAFDDGNLTLHEWPGFRIDYRHHSATYEIVVENPAGVSRGVVSVEVDGEVSATGTSAIALADDGATHRVRVVLG